MKYLIFVFSLLGALAHGSPALADPPVTHTFYRCIAIPIHPAGFPAPFIGRGPAYPIAFREALERCRRGSTYGPCRVVKCDVTVRQ